MRHCLEVCANETPTNSPQRTRKRSNGSQLAIGARWSILLRFTELLLFTTRNDTHHRRQNEAFQELLSLNVHIPSGPFGNRVLFEGCNFRSRSTASCRTITQAHIQRLIRGKTECQLEAPVPCQDTTPSKHRLISLFACEISCRRIREFLLRHLESQKA